MFAGLLIGWARDASKRLRPVIRLVYAPAGETSGYADFDLKAMTETGGRPILAALEMLIGAQRLFNALPDETLPALLVASRKAQAEVSTKLSQQVLAALYALLAGYHEAQPERIRSLTHDDPDALYGGLLTFLMRLVFILYAEDRSLMLSGSAEDRAKGEELYIPHYSLRGLYGQLVDDAARYPDTMDERFGAFGRLLVLFRLVYSGANHGAFQLVGRKGQLFDPERFLFLEGRASGGAQAHPPPYLGRRCQNHSRQSDEPRRGAPLVPQPRRRANRLGLSIGDGLRGRNIRGPSGSRPIAKGGRAAGVLRLRRAGATDGRRATQAHFKGD